MVEAHYKSYLKKLALSINAFWESLEEEATEMIIKAELDLDSTVGKHISKKIYSDLEPYLKKWRELILNYNTSSVISMPEPCQELVHEIDPHEDTPDNTSLTSLISEVPEESPAPRVPTAQEELGEVFELYRDDKIREAINLLEELKLKHRCNFTEDPLVREIESDFEDIKEVFRCCQDKEGWITEATGKIMVSYKNIPGTPTYSLLTEAEIDVPMFNFITLMYEIDLYHTWVPFCKTSTAVANLSRTRKLLYQEYNVPLIATRQACLYGYGANLLHTDGVVVIVSKSCDQNTHFKNVKLPEIGRGKRAVVHMMGCIVRPISYEKIHATIITNFDPMIKLVPYKIMNYFSRKLAKGMFKKIIKKAKNFEGSEYQKRMNMPENREFYEFLEKSQKEYLDSIAGNSKV